MSEIVNTSDATGFIVKINGTAVTIASLNGSGTEVLTLTLDTKVKKEDTVTLNYSGGNVKDIAGNELADISGQAVTNTVEAITFHYAMPSWGDSGTVNLSYYKNGEESASGLSMTKNSSWYEITVAVEDAAATTEFVIEFSDSGTKKFLKADDFSSNVTYSTSTNNIWIDARNITNWGGDNYYLESTKYSDTEIDITAPSFSSGPSTANITGTSFDLNATLNEAGTVYYVVVNDQASAPSAAQVKAGNNALGAAALANGSKTDSGSGVAITVTALSEKIAYDVYVVGEDEATHPNLQGDATKLEVTTLDETAPTVSNAVVEDTAPKDVVLIMSEVVTATDASGFSVNVNGSPVAVNSLSGSGTDTLTLSLAVEIVIGDVVTIDYSNGNVKDSADNLLVDFSSQSVTNNTIVIIDGDIGEADYNSHYTDVMGAGHEVYNWGDNAPTIGEVKTARDENYLYIAVQARTANDGNKESFHILIDEDNDNTTGKKDFSTTPFYNQTYNTEVGVDYAIYVEPSGYKGNGYISYIDIATDGSDSQIRGGEMGTTSELGSLDAPRSADSDFAFELRIPISELSNFDSSSKLIITAAPRYNTTHVHDITPNNGNSIANDDSDSNEIITIPAADSLSGM
ncbi:hypothetical protein JOC47_001648 [Halanaerobacter jeridensis]|uniref:Uncharacterized protein n=2 Tax=Halanaerobacter jeridensis TaxID=706427 RepID=A0A938XPL9_9FIRM|nr:hypothetical protein [Halanaerobacter jeridensis]